MSVRDQLYRSTTNKTFENEADLPSLPVPSLQSTLDLYLDTVKAVTNQEEYENTKKIVGQFISTDGPKIQNLLIERSQKSRNWVIILIKISSNHLNPIDNQYIFLSINLQIDYNLLKIN